jgi:DNA-binding NarL/FixJ family response regulator
MSRPRAGKPGGVNAPPVRVLLPDGRQLVFHGLRGMLAPHQDQVQVLDPGADEAPDVEILDATGSTGGGGGEALAGLVEGSDRRQVVLVDAGASVGLLEQALALGAAGLLSTAEPGDVVADALVRAAGGSVVLSRSLEPVVSAAHRRRWPGEDRGLSRRESQVLVMIAAGRSPEEIGTGLGIAHETVRSHLKRVYHKLQVRDRAGAVAKAWSEGIVDGQTVADIDRPGPAPAPASVAEGGGR